MDDLFEVIMDPVKKEILEIAHRGIAQGEEDQAFILEKFSQPFPSGGQVGTVLRSALRQTTGPAEPKRRDDQGRSSRDEESHRPIEAVNEKAEKMVTRRDPQQR